MMSFGMAVAWFISFLLSTCIAILLEHVTEFQKARRRLLLYMGVPLDWLIVRDGNETDMDFSDDEDSDEDEDEPNKDTGDDDDTENDKDDE